MFKELLVYPLPTEATRIVWVLQPDARFDNPPYTVELQMSRSGTDDWITVTGPVAYTGASNELVDSSQRAWSTTESWYYRVKFVDADDNEVISMIEPALGSLDKRDRLVLREMVRQECLRLVKRVGSKGLLLKRREDGEVPAPASSERIIDPDTGEVIAYNNTETYGTNFVGGYHSPFEYYLEVKAGEVQRTVQEPVGTIEQGEISASGIAFPMPRTNDIWVDCTSNVRYRIDTIQVKSLIRHYPVTLQLVLKELSPTDIAYSVPLP